MHGTRRSRQNRAETPRTAQPAADYEQWLADEMQSSIDDPRPSIPHDRAMAEMDAEIAALTKRA